VQIITIQSPEVEKQRLSFEIHNYEVEKAVSLQHKEEDNAERLRLDDKADADRIRLEQERHLQQVQFEWHRAQAAAADNIQQQAQFIELQRVQANA